MKFARYSVVALLILLLQEAIVTRIAIHRVAPDFLLLFVLLLALREGQVWGALAGLSVGLLQDFVTDPSLTGLSGFSKTLAGFSVGYFYGSRRTRNFLGALSVFAIGVVVHYLAYFAIYVQGSGLGFAKTLFHSGLPLTLYTLLFALLLLSVIPLSRDVD